MHKYYFAKAKEGSLKMLVSCVFRLTKKLHTQAGAPVSTLKKPSRGNAHEDDTYRKRTSSPFRTESWNHKRALSKKEIGKCLNKTREMLKCIATYTHANKQERHLCFSTSHMSASEWLPLYERQLDRQYCSFTRLNNAMQIGRPKECNGGRWGIKNTSDMRGNCRA